MCAVELDNTKLLYGLTVKLERNYSKSWIVWTSFKVNFWIFSNQYFLRKILSTVKDVVYNQRIKLTGSGMICFTVNQWRIVCFPYILIKKKKWGPLIPNGWSEEKRYLHVHKKKCMQPFKGLLSLSSKLWPEFPLSNFHFAPNTDDVEKGYSSNYLTFSNNLKWLTPLPHPFLWV